MPVKLGKLGLCAVCVYAELVVCGQGFVSFAKALTERNVSVSVLSHYLKGRLSHYQKGRL